MPRKAAALAAAVDAAVAAAVENRQAGARPKCSHCHREGHEEPNCFLAHPEKKAEWQKERNTKRNAYRAARETGTKGGGNPNFPPGKGGRMSKPPSFRKVNALTFVGAMLPDLEDRIVIDTGASEDIMILRSVDHFSAIADGLSHVGTASEGSVLHILGTGSAGQFEGVLLAPIVAFNLASGSLSSSKSRPPVRRFCAPCSCR